MAKCQCDPTREVSSFPYLPSSSRTPPVVVGLSCGRREEKQPTVRASVTHNTRDHTALKGVSDRPERGIPQASSTCSVSSSSEWREGIPPKGMAGLDLTRQAPTYPVNGLAAPLLTGGI